MKFKVGDFIKEKTESRKIQYEVVEIHHNVLKYYLESSNPDAKDYLFVSFAEEDKWELMQRDTFKVDKPLKNNAEKAQIGLVRPQYIEGIAKVLTYGATKYSEPRGDEPNYMRGDGFHYSEIYDSLQRHLNTWYSGESLDEETKLNHLLHAASNIMFLYMYEISEKGIDDRYQIKK